MSIFLRKRRDAVKTRQQEKPKAARLCRNGRVQPFEAAMWQPGTVFASHYAGKPSKIGGKP